MNNTINSTIPIFTFTVSDGVFITLQSVTYFCMIILSIFLLIFRKEKELKTRGFLPFFSIFGVFLLSIRFIAQNLSFLKITNLYAFTYK